METAPDYEQSLSMEPIYWLFMFVRRRHQPLLLLLLLLLLLPPPPKANRALE